MAVDVSGGDGCDASKVVHWLMMVVGSDDVWW